MALTNFTRAAIDEFMTKTKGTVPDAAPAPAPAPDPEPAAATPKRRARKPAQETVPEVNAPDMVLPDGV